MAFVMFGLVITTTRYLYVQGGVDLMARFGIGVLAAET